MTRFDLLVLPGASPSSVAIALDTLAAAARLAPRAGIDVRVVSTDAPQVALRGGMSIAAKPLRGARPRDVVLVPGLGEATADEVEARLAGPGIADAARWLRRAHAGGAAVAASCTGVFVLGQAGLLASRRCTSTWWLVPALRRLAPGCDATLDTMVVEDDGVWTAGAAFAQIDLVLALVAHAAGPALAAEVARHLVVEPRASQARFVAPTLLAAQDPAARKVEAEVRRRLAHPHSLAGLADAAGTSPRTLARRLVAATGMAPMRFVQRIRLDAAMHLLRTTARPVDAIAAEVGFVDASALYRLVRRHTGRSPSAFRAEGEARPQARRSTRAPATTGRAAGDTASGRRASR